MTSTSLFLAISGVFKLYLSFILYEAEPHWNLLLTTFFLIFSVYGINKLTDLKEDEINNPERVGYIKKFPKIFKCSIIISFALAIILSAVTGIWAVLVVMFPVCSGVLYSVQISPKYPRLKDITGVKNLIIAITWANGTTFLPYLTIDHVNFIKVFLIYYFFFMKSLINTILFDLRDIDGDRTNGIKTLPVKLGFEKSKVLLLFLNSTFIPWLLIGYYFRYFSRVFLVLAFSILNGYWYILRFSNKRRKIGKDIDLIVDGEWLYTTPLALMGI
ncbi:UbiA family prenyltransferase [Palaeococcus pacificus]|uniref:UbiA family prenyltransferase n=1 Tax=Palaeococcus pacificus TaxID=971279 RepID=UPI00130D7C0B|nr:UbiA family prenyltransferase [Palaeococcus pacificus]